MSFFQNPTTTELRSSLILGDRQYSVEFVCPANAGRGDEYITAWNKGPYNLSGNDGNGNPKSNLVVMYAQNDKRNIQTLSVNVAGATPSATSAAEITTILNADPIFSDYFTTTLEKFEDGKDRLFIKQNKPFLNFWFFVKNGQAESAIGFNARAGVSEMPTGFVKHTIANRYVYPDSANRVVLLDPSSTVDQAIIDNAVNEKGVNKGYNHSVVKADYQLFAGRSGLFLFQKNTVDGSNRITQTIEYAAGSVAGDLGKKTNYTYTSTNTNPTNVTNVPYTLVDADLITPP